MKKSILLFFICSCVLLFIGVSPAMAVPASLVYTPNPMSVQDPMPECFNEELGNKPPFPDNEWITSSWTNTTYVPCPLQYGGGQNVAVSMTNHTNITWECVAYVADPETTITNDDKLLINNEEAFLIDNGGKNQPLIYESMGQNNIFEPGETWTFVIQEYSNSKGLGAAKFASIGVGSGSFGDYDSSGSIIVCIPEPATICLLGLGGLALLRRNRK